ncbi:Hypothetical protein A7982_07632 [Minicystis rosea]|nr:Hypothetical protein A7982_07632 [Minicystis rosea]
MIIAHLDRERMMSSGSRLHPGTGTRTAAQRDAKRLWASSRLLRLYRIREEER